MDLNRRLPRVDSSRFSMVPRADIPRSTFVTTHTIKTTFDFDNLVPWFVDEVLPGDVHQGQVTIFARLATLLFPVMDRVEIETFFFFVPARILWTNWKKMMGERANPADSISYTVPQYAPANGSVSSNTVSDYFGIPPGAGFDAADTFNALPYRAYIKIWNDWFRDENLDNSLTEQTGDGPDPLGGYETVLKRRKRHDYFTSALPWPLKGGTEVTVPVGGAARVMGIAISNAANPIDGTPAGYYETSGTLAESAAGLYGGAWAGYLRAETANNIVFRTEDAAASNQGPAIYADLATATGTTLNALRLAITTQHLLERDARSGTRYTELLRAHFGVIPEDARLQRPEYIGGGRTDVQTNAIPQTSATGLTGGATPLGALGAAAVASDQHSFSYHATEHGYIIGLVNARAEITYQQGVHRMWTRSTRYDFYWPAFAHLGEQSIRNDEIFYNPAANATNILTFGYQERWAEYRHRPSKISGLFRSQVSGNIDDWHLAEQFSALPALNATFITSSTPASRVLAAGAAANGMQVLMDSLWKIKCTRPMPMFSVPGLDRF